MGSISLSLLICSPKFIKLVKLYVLINGIKLSQSAVYAIWMNVETITNLEDLEEDENNKRKREMYYFTIFSEYLYKQWHLSSFSYSAHKQLNQLIIKFCRSIVFRRATEKPMPILPINLVVSNNFNLKFSVSQLCGSRTHTFRGTSLFGSYFSIYTK